MLIEDQFIEKIFRPIIAATLTITLFSLMSYLIKPDGGIPQEATDNPVVSLARHERDEQTQRKERNLPEKPEQKEPPPPPPLVRPQTRVTQTSDLVVDIQDWGGEKIEFNTPSDRHATPIVRIPPQYPHNLLNREIEGWVIVEFTITTAGTVDDVEVIDSEPPEVFNRSVRRAIKRWKYQPKLVDGKPVPQFNMRELFTFKIEK